MGRAVVARDLGSPSDIRVGYLNYHRPCGFATVEVSDQGKRRRRYRLADYRTP